MSVNQEGSFLGVKLESRAFIGNPGAVRQLHSKQHFIGLYIAKNYLQLSRGFASFFPPQDV